MLKLIRNEYRKLFCKKGTYVLLAVVLLITAGFHFLLNSSLLSDSYAIWQPNEDNVRSDLEFYKSNNANGDFDVQVAVCEAMLRYKVYDVDYFTPQKPQSWQGEALNNAYYNYYATMLESEDEADVAEAKKQFDALIACVESGDWHMYCQNQSALYAQDSPNTAYTYQYMLDHEIDPNSGDWRLSVLRSLQQNADTLDFYEIMPEKDRGARYEQAKKAYDICRYRLEQDIRYCAYENENMEITGQRYIFSSPFWQSMYITASLLSIISIMLIVIAGGIVASEFSQGTIKFLLINPVKRGKILFSKYFMLLSLTALLTAGMFVFNTLLSLFTAEGADAVYLTWQNGTVTARSIFPLVLSMYGFQMVQCILLTTLSFMFSSLLRSSSVAIGVSLGALFLGNTITSTLAYLGQDWGRYLIFANMDLESILNKASLFPHHSPGFAVAVIAVHMVLFLLTAYDGFVRREV